jgi:hypothetical protein
MTNMCRKFYVLMIVLSTLSCATHSARQTPAERVDLKAALIEGEIVVRANSCSKVPKATFLAGGKAVFGSCYLTNLRFIYEESEWARNLMAVSKAIPTSGDFGIKHLMKGAVELFNANYIIDLGMDGKLHLVERTGQIILPLSDIKSMQLSGSRFSTRNTGPPEKARWLTVANRNDFTFVFEIYDLPPDKTGTMPTFDSYNWKQSIEDVRSTSFGESSM